MTQKCIKKGIYNKNYLMLKRMFVIIKNIFRGIKYAYYLNVNKHATIIRIQQDELIKT